MNYNVQWKISNIEIDPKWDEFLGSIPGNDYQQTSLWANVKNVQGWNAIRIYGVQEQNITQTSDNIFSIMSGFSGGAEYVWLTTFLLTGGAAFILAKMLQSSSIIGVWLFSSVFWTSYHNCLTVVNVNNWLLEFSVFSDFILIATVGLLFIWIGAVIGMLTGSG